MANPAPKAREPTSPIKILAGFQLKIKNPINPPTTLKQKNAISTCFECNAKNAYVP